MRRTAAVLGTAAALGAGTLVALPGPATAATAPTLVSVKASPGSVTTVGKLNAARKVTVTAVYNDPDDVLKNVAFSTSGPIKPNVGLNSKDFTAVKSGTRRTFSWVFQEDYNADPGVRRAYVVGQVGYGTNVAGTAGSTTYVVKQKPLLYFSGVALMSAMWGTKSRFYGDLSSTGAPGDRKIKVQFKANGKGKKYVTKQTLRTNADGQFFTKKFKINKAGKWRASFTGTKYVLAVKSKAVTAKKPY